jgi:hypothetical protein
MLEKGSWEMWGGEYDRDSKCGGGGGGGEGGRVNGAYDKWRMAMERSGEFDKWRVLVEASEEGEEAYNAACRGYFEKRASRIEGSGFVYKLFNALKAVEARAELKDKLGVWWKGNDVCVNGVVFGGVLGLRAGDGALFHKQGNMRSHGFVEKERVSGGGSGGCGGGGGGGGGGGVEGGVESELVRVYGHEVFNREVGMEEVKRIRWVRPVAEKGRKRGGRG